MLNFNPISILIPAFTLLLSSQAYSVDIQCNRSQSKCITSNANLAIGDRVGIFNRSEELVAVGKVKSMTGQRRSVKIYKSYGKIFKGHQIALLGSDVRKISQVEEKYDIYTPYAERNFGFDVGIASMAVGGYLSGTEVTGHGQWVAYKHLDYVLRGTLLRATGKISRGNVAVGVESKEMQLFAAGVLPGVSATLFEKNLISARGEIDAGFMYVAADLDGDSGLVEGSGFATKVLNGFNGAARIAVSLQLNLGDWRTELLAAQSVINEARVSTIGFGVSKDLR